MSYLIPKTIKVDKSSWSRKLLAKCGLMSRKYKKIDIQKKLIDDMRDKKVGD